MTKIGGDRPGSFNVKVDFDLYKLLNLMIGYIQGEDDDGTGFAFANFLIEVGLADRWLKFLDEFSEKSHEQDFCLDPNCIDKVAKRSGVKEQKL